MIASDREDVQSQELNRDGSPSVTGKTVEHASPFEGGDASLESLRELLVGDYVARINALEAELDFLELRVSDKAALVGLVKPVMADVIRLKIQESREEMIEILYPIIGQLIVRAVSEAIADLARTVDARLQDAFSPKSMQRRFGARMRGVSSGEMMLRDSLPFAVTEVFLIYRENGILLDHVSVDPVADADSDLISGMLTAVRDFAQDAFGRGEEGQLDAIEYGDRRILVEAAKHAYLAVVVQGVEPVGFRSTMREQIISIQNAYFWELVHFDGDVSKLATVRNWLTPFMGTAEKPDAPSRLGLSRVFALILVVLLIACVAVVMIWRGGNIR